MSFTSQSSSLFIAPRLIGLVVKASALRVEDPGFKSRLRPFFFGSSHTSDLKIGSPVATLPGAWQGSPVATLPGAWRYRVSAGTGWLSVSILWLDEMESLICNFHLSVAAHKIVSVTEIHSPVAGMLTLHVLHHTTPHKQVAPNCKICAASITLRYFEGNESFSIILCLLVKINI